MRLASFGITVEFDTVKKSLSTATLRERDSIKQIRVEVAHARVYFNVQR